MSNPNSELTDLIRDSMPYLTPEEVRWWMDHQKELERLLVKLHLTAEKSRAPVTRFLTWRTVFLGTDLKTADEFRHAIMSDGKRIGDWANDFLGKSEFTTADTLVEVGLVNVSAAELGLNRGGTYEQIYSRALQRGLKLCSPEVGPQLCLQYTNQPLDECLLIGMKLFNAHASYRVFTVCHNYFGRWLDVGGARFGYVWHPSVRWIFVAS